MRGIFISHTPPPSLALREHRFLCPKSANSDLRLDVVAFRVEDLLSLAGLVANWNWIKLRELVAVLPVSLYEPVYI